MASGRSFKQMVRANSISLLGWALSGHHSTRPTSQFAEDQEFFTTGSEHRHTNKRCELTVSDNAISSFQTRVTQTPLSEAFKPFRPPVGFNLILSCDSLT